MSIEKQMDQLAEIFARNDVPFQTDSAGEVHRVLYGSTAVFVSAHNWTENGTIVHLHAFVVSDFDLNAHAPTALTAINDLNHDLYFAKFVVQAEEAAGRGTISVEYDLLGGDLQGSELMNALALLAELADNTDDRLQADIGGKTYADLMAEAQNLDSGVMNALSQVAELANNSDAYAELLAQAQNQPREEEAHPSPVLSPNPHPHTEACNVNHQ